MRIWTDDGHRTQGDGIVSVHENNRTEFTYGFLIGMIARDPRAPEGLAAVLFSICMEAGLTDKTLPNLDAIDNAVALVKSEQERIIGRPLDGVPTKPRWRWPWTRSHTRRDGIVIQHPWFGNRADKVAGFLTDGHSIFPTGSVRDYAVGAVLRAYVHEDDDGNEIEGPPAVTAERCGDLWVKAQNEATVKCRFGACMSHMGSRWLAINREDGQTGWINPDIVTFIAGVVGGWDAVRQTSEIRGAVLLIRDGDPIAAIMPMAVSIDTPANGQAMTITGPKGAA